MTTDRPYDFIVSGSQAVFTTWYFSGSSGRILDELLFAEPLLNILCRNYRLLTVQRQFVRHVDKDKFVLTIRSRNPYIKGLNILRKTFFDSKLSQKQIAKNISDSSTRSYWLAYLLDIQRKKSRLKARALRPSWNRRRSLSLYGTTQLLPSVPLPLSDRVTNLILPLGVGDIVTELTRFRDSATLRDHCSFDNIRIIALRLVPFVGNTFYRTTTLSRHGEHYLSALAVTTDSIEIVLTDIKYVSSPSSSKMELGKAVIRIDRHGVGSYEPVISVQGLQNTIINGTPTIKPPAWRPSVQGQVIIQPTDSRDSAVTTQNLVSSYGFEMRKLRPALYHSQGRALTKALADYGSNFENFVQSPQLLDLISQLYDGYPKLFYKIFDPSSGYIQRLGDLVKLISGGILAWNFAAAPSLRAVQDQAKKNLVAAKNEGVLKIEVDYAASLPEGLRNLLASNTWPLDVPVSLINHCEFNFRSEVVTTPDYVTLARALLEHSPAVNLHVLPTPKGVWDYAPFSFVVDWFIPIGREIEDNFSYFTSPVMPFRIGHTAHGIITFSDGRTVNLFWRSSESNLPIDPPGDTWLSPGALPWISVPFGVQQLLNFR